MEERWDIYDTNRQKTGRTMSRNDWNMKPGDFHLTAIGAVMRSDGRFLITKRVATKAYAPGQWEISGGGVLSGETSEEAVVREIKEETGLDVSHASGGRVFTYTRENPEEGDNYFMDVYRFEMDFSESDIRLQESETDGFRLATAEEIKKLGEEGNFLHYASIRRLFEDI